MKKQDWNTLKLPETAERGLQFITELLHSERDIYTWVGFYFMDHERQQLHLGPFTGKPTDHTVIPFGKGICGQVALSGTTYIAEDVQQETNYIACSLEVQSEIVVPLYVQGKLVAQLDIDSDTPNAFTAEDEVWLNDLCAKLSDTYGGALDYTRFFQP